MGQKETALAGSSTCLATLKSIGAGIVAVLAAGGSLVGIFALIARLLGGDVRPGATLSWKTGVTAALIFALGFAWQFRRSTQLAREMDADKKATRSAAARRG